MCPGIAELLADLHPRPGVVLGLLTGNVRSGANTSSATYGLWDYFVCGGFGDEHYDRDDVARTAVAEVRAHLGRDVDTADVWVIGDTPLDVQCARAVGARGRRGRDRLAPRRGTGRAQARSSLRRPVEPGRVAERLGEVELPNRSGSSSGVVLMLSSAHTTARSRRWRSCRAAGYFRPAPTAC